MILVDIVISMIIDRLHHAGCYSHPSARFDAGFAFLKGLDFGALKPGRMAIARSTKAREILSRKPRLKGFDRINKIYRIDL